MDLRLSPVSVQTPLRATTALRSLSTPAPEPSGAGFSTALKGALSSVSAAQNQAQALERQVQMENPTVSLEETMVAIQKAQIGFQATLNVRNRMVQAYNDIMNMQV
jgi:flagellar hook-basal body complex protein FliE